MMLGDPPGFRPGLFRVRRLARSAIVLSQVQQIDGDADSPWPVRPLQGFLSAQE